MKPKANPETHTVIGRRVVKETGAVALKAVGKSARRALPDPPTKDSKIKPYKRSIKTSGTAPAGGEGPIKTGPPKGELKTAGALQNVEVRDTYRLRKKGGILRLQKVSGHKRSLTKKRLRREGKI